ncbi:MAG: CHAT domain-containing protein [Ignavibacteria bacterium]|nr:CHAT domain-containing protein [Ignavibacteria bacterium]
MKKPVIIFSSMIIFVLVGLAFIAAGFISTNNFSINQNNSKEITETKKSDPNFTRLEFSLLNHTDVTSISDSIDQLTDNFDKNYLLALLEKRKFEYDNSFNRLYSLLPNFPAYFPFYDELIFTAKASDNIKLLTKFIPENKSTNNFSEYLLALINYHENKYSDAVQTLKNKKEFEELYLLSYSYRGLGDYDKALQIMDKSESLISIDNNMISKVFVSKGSLYLLSGKYDEAEKFYKKGLESAKRFGDRREEIKALINLAILDDQNGNVDEAKQKLELALQISRSIKNQELEATALSELAVSYTYSGNVVEAKNNYEKSFRIFKILNHKERLSNLCANIASLYSQTANYSSAISFYEDGLSYAGENVSSKILNLRGLGDVYSNLSNYSKSLNYYEEAKKLSQQIKDVSAETSVDVSLGTLYYNVNKPIKALQIFIDAKNKLDLDNDPYSAEDVFFKIGLAYSKIDSLNKSNDALLNALSLAESLNDVYYKTIISTELGHNYALQKDFSKAENVITKAMQLSKSTGLNQNLGLQNLYLGEIAFAKGNLGNAAKYFELASSLAEKEMDYNNVLEAEYLLAKTYKTKNDIVKAEEHYLRAVELGDKISESLVDNAEIQIAHFSGLNDCYDELAELYFEQNRNEEAFLIIEKSHSRNTLQNLTDLKINSLYNNKEKLNRFYDLKWMVNSGLFSGNKLEEINSEYVNLKSEIYNVNPELKSALEKNKPFSIKEIQKSLGENENLITLFFGKTNLYFINITRNKSTVKKAGVSKEETIKLLSNIAPLYSSDSNGGDLYLNQDLFSFNTKEANVFYKKVIEPFVNDIPMGESLIFSMPAELAFVPLEFLVTEFNEDDSPFYYDNKKYLIDDYAVSYSPSSSIYVMQKRMNQKNEDKVLLVGDPQISNKDFALSYRGGLLEDDSFNARNIVLFPLRYSKEEIQNLNSLFANGLVLLSDNATEKNFKENASQSSIIHLSTHSFLLKNQPLIIFSQNEDKKEDGYLETGEILQLKLNSDLVVLSSCRSGLGNVDKAEGVIGMQKSFFEAGAKSVVVSLWDVNDKYTSLFMQSFYKFLSDGFDKSESLRKAKLFFKKNYSANPYYWSAFVLSGDISKINTLKTSSANYLLYILLGVFVSILAIYFARRKTS